MGRLRREYGLRYFFGADDNFLDNRAWALEMAETLARAQLNGRTLSSQVGWSTEVTVHDTWRIRDHLPLIHRAGVQALWLGVEDLTARLIRKGQSIDKTVEVFRLLRRSGIFPIPMVMHHDAQPFYTADSPYGLLNQVWLLQKAGAIDLQITMMTPAIGSRHYDEAFASGLVYARVGRRPVEQRRFDGNHVVASAHEKPWRKQLNIIAAYLCFYNPLRFLAAIARTASTIGFLNAIALQVIWVWGMIQTVRRTFTWALRLMRGPIERSSGQPVSRIPMRGVDGRAASHAPPGTPLAEHARAAADVATAEIWSGVRTGVLAGTP